MTNHNTNFGITWFSDKPEATLMIESNSLRDAPFKLNFKLNKAQTMNVISVLQDFLKTDNKVQGSCEYWAYPRKPLR